MSPEFCCSKCLSRIHLIGPAVDQSKFSMVLCPTLFPFEWWKPQVSIMFLAKVIQKMAETTFFLTDSSQYDVQLENTTRMIVTKKKFAFVGLLCIQLLVSIVYKYSQTKGKYAYWPLAIIDCAEAIKLRINIPFRQIMKQRVPIELSSA